MTVFAPDWLTARPIAHRGLHDSAKGIIENSAEAAEAAIAAGFAIECDVQLSRDGEAMVFHDDTLERLTLAAGPVRDRSAGDLAALVLRGGRTGPPRFANLLARIAGRTPLICEIKSRFDGDGALLERVVRTIADYAGPLALKSFDPEVIARLRAHPPRSPDGALRPLGIVAMANYTPEEWPELTETQRRGCAAFLHIRRTMPDFLSFHVDDLPHPTPTLLKALRESPTITWTVRNAAQRARAKAYADQIIFEGEGRP